MPLSLNVPQRGRTGPAARVARGEHELEATGKAASVASHLETDVISTTTAAPDGRPLVVRLPYVLAMWLVLGMLTVSDEVASLYVYEYMVSPERMGAALDFVLSSYEYTDKVTPSVFRRRLLLLAGRLRIEQPMIFIVTLACLMVVGGNADDLACGDLPAPMNVGMPLSPAWFGCVTFRMLLPRCGTLIVFSELEFVWWPRLFASQRTAGGGISMFESLLIAALAAEERPIITALADAGRAELFCALAVTLLPTALEMTNLPASPAAAALSCMRAFTRASSAPVALAISIHEVLTVIPHYPVFLLAIGTEMGAPAALGLLLELVRAALGSATAQLTLGNVAAAAELYNYLQGRLAALAASHAPPSDRVAFALTTLKERAQLVQQATRGGGGSGGGGGQPGGGGGGGGSTAGNMGYAAMYVAVLLSVLANSEFISIVAELTANLDAHLDPNISIDRILQYRGIGHAILQHALRGLVTAVRDLPIVFRIVSELRPHGPQWASDTLANALMPPDSPLVPRIMPAPSVDLWNLMCKALYWKINLENAMCAILAQCQGHSSFTQVPDALQYGSMTRIRRLENATCAWFAAWGFELGGLRAWDTFLATVTAYHDDATAIPVHKRMQLVNSVIQGALREASDRCCALLAARRPDELMPTEFIVPNSPAVRSLQRARTDAPRANELRRSMASILSDVKAAQMGLETHFVPPGMESAPAQSPGAALNSVDPATGGGSVPSADKPSAAEKAQAKADAAADKANAAAAEAGAAATKGEKPLSDSVVGSGVAKFVDLTQEGKFGLGEASARQWFDLAAFYRTSGVPRPAGGVPPPVTDPGPNCCPVVWCSRSAGNEHAFCPAAGKSGHERGGTAHNPPNGWRKKFLNGLVAVAVASAPQGADTAHVAATRASPFAASGSSLSALAAPFAPRVGGAVFATLRVESYALPSLGPLAELCEPPAASGASWLEIAAFESHGGLAFVPVWHTSPEAPHVALPDGSGCRLFGSDDASVLALSGGPLREASLVAAAVSTSQIFTAARTDLVLWGALAVGASVPEDRLGDYSVHSFRIYLACALLASGCPRFLIKRMLRWRGDESLEIYARASDQEFTKHLTGALGATVDAALVPRLPVMDFSPEQESAFLTMAHSLLNANF